MGRKPKKKYFDIEEEQAVVDYLMCEDELEKNKIFNEKLYAPLSKMIDSIIRKYKLYLKSVDYVDLHAEVFSFLLTKFDKFKPSEGKKAYSYYGTICKRYLINERIKEDKKIQKEISYEDIYLNEEDADLLDDSLIKDDKDFKTLINDLIAYIDNESVKPDLNDNEKKVGFALVEILTNWESLFELSEDKKFSKNLFLLYMREYTLLTTKEIRNSLKRYKLLYEVIKIDFIKNET